MRDVDRLPAEVEELLRADTIGAAPSDAKARARQKLSLLLPPLGGLGGSEAPGAGAGSAGGAGAAGHAGSAAASGGKVAGVLGKVGLLKITGAVAVMAAGASVAARVAPRESPSTIAAPQTVVLAGERAVVAPGAAGSEGSLRAPVLPTFTSPASLPPASAEPFGKAVGSAVDGATSHRFSATNPGNERAAKTTVAPDDLAVAPVLAASGAAGGAAVSSVASATPRRPDPLSQEKELLDRALAALARGSFPEASAALDDHARRFAHGQLASERDALRLRVRKAEGRTVESEDLARRSREKYSSDPPKISTP